MLYLKELTVDEISEDLELCAKYNLTHIQLRTESALQKGLKEELYTIPIKDNQVSKKEYKNLINNIKINYLKTYYPNNEDMLIYYRVNYIKNQNLRYNPISHKYRHIAVYNNNQKWIITLHKSRNNAFDIENQVKGRCVVHNDEDIFIHNNCVFLCEIVGKQNKTKLIKIKKFLQIIR